jgi:ParB family transcriptional regulator, chromosome partitioning protein
MDYFLGVTPFRERRYASIPIAQIKVINGRNRDQEQFDMNAESIHQVGLLKPIRVPGATASLPSLAIYIQSG